MQPATHAAPRVENLEPLPTHLSGALEVPAKDAFVDLQQFGKALPLVTERLQRSERLWTDSVAGRRAQIRVTSEELRVMREERAGHP